MGSSRAAGSRGGGTKGINEASRSIRHRRASRYCAQRPDARSGRCSRAVRGLNSRELRQLADGLAALLAQLPEAKQSKILAGNRIAGAMSARHARSCARDGRAGASTLSPRSLVRLFARMRSILIRFAVPTLIAVSILAFFGVPYVDRILADWFRSDVDMRAQLVAHSMQGSLAGYLERGDEKGLGDYLAAITTDERLMAIVLCDDGHGSALQDGAHSRRDRVRNPSRDRGPRQQSREAGGRVSRSIFISHGQRQRPGGHRAHRSRPELHRPPSVFGAQLRARAGRQLPRRCSRCFSDSSSGC